MRSRRFLILVSIVCLMSLPAQAYLDPGSGSLILQLVLSGVAGLFLLLKVYWYKLKSILGRSKEKPETD